MSWDLYEGNSTAVSNDSDSFLQTSWGLDSKASTCNAVDTGSIPGSGRSPGEGKGNPFQYSHLGNSTDRGAWQATVPGVATVRHDWATNTI